MPNRFQPIQAGTEANQQLAIINKNFAELDQENIVKVMYGNDGVPRIMIDSRTGTIKVAPEGVDVTTASEDDLHFNSSQNVFKVVATGTISLPSATLNTGGANYGFNAGTSTTIAHGLGYIPAVLAFVVSGGQYVPTPWEFQNGITSSSFCRATYRVVVDGTNVTGVTELWGYNVNTSIGATTARYYLLQESAN